MNMNTNKPRLIVVPSLFPKDQDDIRGIFVVDWIRVVELYYSVEVICYEFSNEIDPGIYQEEIHGIIVHRLVLKGRKGSFGKIVQYWNLYRLFIQYFKRKLCSARIIHVHGASLPGFMVVRAITGVNVPILITEHTGPFNKISNSFFLRNMARYALRRSDVFLPVSKDLYKQVIDAGISHPNTIVLGNPVDTSLFEPDGDLKREKAILFVGRLESYKGAMKLLKSFHALSLDKWKLWIIGEGPEYDDLKAFVETNQLDRRVLLFGKLSKRDISMYMKRASFLAFPSEHETFGLVVVEALASGLPVLVSEGTVFVEYVDESNGILVDLNKERAIEQGLLSLIENLSSYNSNEIRSHVVQRFSFENFGGILRQIYSDVINKVEISQKR